MDNQTKIVNEIFDELERGGYKTYPYNADQKIFKIAGYAGTGKTTLLTMLRKRIAMEMQYVSVAFVTFTGKASSVLKSKLIQNDAFFERIDYIGTIHSLIYKPIVKWDGDLKTYVICGWERKDKENIGQHIIIIDEASMVNEDIWNDLLQLGRTIIAVGDHGQLPPIGDKFNLLDNPNYILTEIHRQALDSPIIGLSKFIREEGYIPFNKFFSKDVFKLSWNHKLCKEIWNNKINFEEDELQILTAFNTTRANLNDKIRRKFNFNEPNPYPGEKIVCLQNNHNTKIMNGQIGTLVWLMPENKHMFRATVNIDETMYECLISKKCFGEVTYTMYDDTSRFKKQNLIAKKCGFAKIDYFDFAYCISVHKSQGSEWNKVILIEQRTKKWDDDYYAKWLYTAATRAKEKLFVISDYWD